MILGTLIASLLLTGSTSAAWAAGGDPEYADSGSMGSPERSRAEAAALKHPDERWEYDPYYIFPLTRHMEDSGLPFPAQVALYPVAFALDLGQWPIGALAGLAGK